MPDGTRPPGARQGAPLPSDARVVVLVMSAASIRVSHRFTMR
jgi:hypothetical protein